MFRSLYRHDGWDVGIVHAPVAAVLSAELPPVTWLTLASGGAFAADPFVVEEDGELLCFFEALPYAQNRGKICYVRIDAGRGVTQPPVDAIRAPFHLSYPFMLRYEGEWLCIPEAGESGAVTAYAARSFPNGWYAKQTLIPDFPAIDPTFVYHDGRWWMFATDARAGWNEALHVWYADELFGRWTPHPKNPVKTTLSGARPAGAVFAHDGALYRPGQDCALRYGNRVIVHRIEELSTQAFREIAVTDVGPAPDGPFPHGLHTLNGTGSVTVIDGNRLHFVRQLALQAIMRKVGRMPLARQLTRRV